MSQRGYTPLDTPVCPVRHDRRRTDTDKQFVEPKKQEEQTNWIYAENEDKMTSKKIYNAYIEAKEDLSFSFPYN